MRTKLINRRVARLLGAAAVMATAVTGAVTTSATPAFATGFGQVTGSAVDIGVGADDTVWVVGTPVNEAGGGNKIYRWNRSTSHFEQITGGGARIDVDNTGNAWLVNNRNQLFFFDGKQFDMIPVPSGSSGVTDVGVGGPNNTVWVIGNDVQNHGHSIYKRTGNSWTKEPGEAVEVDVDKAGNAWVVNQDPSGARYVFHWNGSSFVGVTQEQANDIGVGAGGDVWITNFTNNNASTGGYLVEKLNPDNSTWKQVNGRAWQISSGPHDDPWVTNSSHQIFQCPPGDCG